MKSKKSSNKKIETNTKANIQSDDTQEEVATQKDVKKTSQNTTKTSSKSLKTAGTVYVVTPSNVGLYIYGFGNIRDTVKDGDTLDFQGTFSKGILIDRNLTITSTGHNAVFEATNIYVGSKDDSKVINATISNLTINMDSIIDNVITVSSKASATIENNVFNINSTVSSSTISLNGTNNSIVKNNTINLKALAKSVTYFNDGVNYEGTADTYGIGVFNASNILVEDNYVNVSALDSSSDYSTIVGIAVQGTVINNVTVTNVTISNNNIYIKGKGYTYGITMQYNVQNSNILSNNITSTDKTGYYYNGIQLSAFTSNNIVRYNKINLESASYTYGIIVQSAYETNTNYNVIRNNIITLNSSKTRGIEVYLANNTQVRSNGITCVGDYSSGIALGGSSHTEVSLNTIKTQGKILDESNEGDYIPYLTGGIYVTDGEYYKDNQTHTQIYSDNDISPNNINTNGVDVYESHNKTLAIKIKDNHHITLNTNATVHTITQDNYKDYFLNNTGLSDLVNDGDVLDLQGTIDIDYFLYVTKPVTIISTTGDGMLRADTQIYHNGRRLQINSTGSYTNITNIKLHNIELFTSNASYITINYVNSTNINAELGTGTGVHSFRDGSSHITITNSYFHTENNGGHSNIVTAGCAYFTFINNTILGVGMVGNLFYFTTYNAQEGADNGYGICINNTIIGPEVPLQICYAMTIFGENNYFEGNYIQYTGEGVRGQFGTSNSINNTFVNNTFNGTGINLPNTVIKYNKGMTYLTTGGTTEVVGNEADTLTIQDSNGISIVSNIIKNNVVLSDVNSSIFENNTFNGTLTINGNNNTIKYNDVLFSNQTFYTVSINGSNNTVQYNNLILLEQALNGDSVTNVVVATGDEAVSGVEGNIVSNNGPIYYEYNVTSYTQLVQAIEDIKVNGSLSGVVLGYIINLQEGNYTITTPISWGSGSSNVHNITINGNNQVINGENENSFINIATDYSLTINNVTIKNSIQPITNKGYLKMNYCTVTNNTAGSMAVIYNNGGTMDIYNSVFTNNSDNYMYVIVNQRGTFNFMGNKLYNNTVFNGLICNYDHSVNSFIKDNIFENNNFSISFFSVNGGVNYILDNTFINKTIIDFAATDSKIVMHYNNKFINASIPVNVNVESETTNLVNEDYKGSVSLVVDSSFDYNTPLSDGVITVFVNGVEYKSFNIVNGSSNISVENRVLNKYSNDVVVRYVPVDNNCAASEQTVTVNVDQTADNITTNLIVNDTNIHIGVPSIINVTVVTDDNTPVIDRNITFTISGHEFNATTDVNGVASFNYTANREGSFIVGVNYTGEDRYQPSNNSFSVNISRIGTQITVDSITTILYGNITLKATIVDEYGNIINNGRAVFKINGITVKNADGNPIYANVRNSVATINYTIPNTWKNLNAKTITCVYGGTNQYQDIRSDDSAKLSFVKANATMSITTNNNIKQGEKLQITTKINSDIPVTDGKVIFKLDGITLKDENQTPILAQVTNGTASINYTIPVGFSGRDYNLTVVYSDSVFGRIESNSTVTIEKSNIFVDMTPQIATRFTNTSFTAKLINEQGSLVNKTTQVSIKLNNKTVQTLTVTNGIINTTIPTDTLRQKYYYLTVVTGENNAYKSSSTETVLFFD